VVALRFALDHVVVLPPPAADINQPVGSVAVVLLPSESKF
jgi:hypothetical protein